MRLAYYQERLRGGGFDPIVSGTTPPTLTAWVAFAFLSKSRRETGRGYKARKDWDESNTKRGVALLSPTPLVHILCCMSMPLSLRLCSWSGNIRGSLEKRSVNKAGYFFPLSLILSSCEDSGTWFLNFST